MIKSPPAHARPLSVDRLHAIDPGQVRLIVVPDTRDDYLPPTELPHQLVADRHQNVTRIFDVGVSLVILLCSLPVLIVVTVLVKLTSPGNIIYRQTRSGRSGQPFVLYKFRTMVMDADTLLVSGTQRHADFQDKWKLDNDPRVTWVGKWLRKTSVDELPQIINVLRGDMSLVGPRPVRPDELLVCYGEYANRVFSVKPGLTGLWQVTGRSDVSYDTRIALDLEYLQRRSFWFDCALLVRTIPAVLFMRGAM